MMERGINRIMLESILNKRIIAIIRKIPSKHILSVAKALSNGGISNIEVTFDQSGAEGVAETLRSIEILNEENDGEMCIGAGTVLNTQQVDDAKKAGAEYIISPNFDAKVIERTKSLGLISIPGAFTPSEIIRAYEAGGDIIKVFPAMQLGVSYLKALQGPIKHIPLAAVGGVEARHLPELFKIGIVCVGVGGNLVNSKYVQEGKFDVIEEIAKAYSRHIASN